MDWQTNRLTNIKILEVFSHLNISVDASHIFIYSWWAMKRYTLVQNSLLKTIQDHLGDDFYMQKEGLNQYNKSLQMHVMFTNKESNTNMQTMCLWLLKVAVSFRSSERSLFWDKEFSGARRNLIKLVNLLLLCHLFVIFYHTALPAVGLTALYFIT